MCHTDQLAQNFSIKYRFLEENNRHVLVLRTSFVVSSAPGHRQDTYAVQYGIKRQKVVMIWQSYVACDRLMQSQHHSIAAEKF